MKIKKRALPPLDPKEDAIHIALMTWCKLALRSSVVCFHVPNGGLRTKREAAKLTAMGVVAGIPDLIFIAEGRIFGLELKRSNGRQSRDQRCVMKRLDAAGVYTGTAYGLDAAMAMVRAWGLTRDMKPGTEPATHAIAPRS